MLWSNSNGIMRIMDRQDDYWKQHMGFDLEKLMRESNRMLVEGMMTEEAKKAESTRSGSGTGDERKDRRVK